MKIRSVGENPQDGFVCVTSPSQYESTDSSKRFPPFLIDGITEVVYAYLYGSICFSGQGDGSHASCGVASGRICIGKGIRWYVTKERSAERFDDGSEFVGGSGTFSVSAE